jgi:hypothetical protein
LRPVSLGGGLRGTAPSVNEIFDMPIAGNVGRQDS